MNKNKLSRPTSLNKKPNRILGLDPGFGRLGYAIIEEQNREWIALKYGVIETKSDQSFVERLLVLNKGINALITEYKPQAAAIEELFFAKNVTTALKVAQARGALLLTLVQAHIHISEFTPLEVKQTLTGYGRADKHQIDHMVKLIFHLEKVKILDDAADALAIAWCATV